MAAYSLHHNLTRLGNYLRRMKAKLGPKSAAMATAHKIAVIVYTMVKNQVEYDETIWGARDAQSEESLQAKLGKPNNLGQHTEKQIQAVQRVPQTHSRFLPNAAALPVGGFLGSANYRFPHLFDFRVQ